MVTPDELEELVNRGDAVKVAEAAESLSEGQRRTLSKAAAKIHGSRSRWAHWSGEYQTAGIATLAFCSRAEAQKVSGRFDRRYAPTAVRVLTDRRPEWIDDWVTRKMTGPVSDITWRFLRALIKAGLCQKPSANAYGRVIEFGAYEWHWDQRTVPISQQLLDEPELLEDVWLLFEADVTAFYFDPVEQHGRNPAHESWSTALLRLSERGRVDRLRLLDACLDGLGHAPSNAALTGLIRFHDRLQPTTEEIHPRQADYLKLLASRATHVVTFALDVLSQLEKAGSLDADAFFAAVPAVFALKPKGQSKAALTLAAKLATRKPELVPAAVNVAIEALAHESAEVQKQAIEMLEGWRPRLHADHAIALRERLDGLAASVRGQAEAILQSFSTSPVTGEGVESPTAASGSSAEELTDRTLRLDERWRRLAGVDEALECLRSHRLPAPLEFDLLEVPVLTGVAPIAPIESADQLLDAVAHAIEAIDSADELERILDGISRLCDQRPADLAVRAAPLTKRLRGARPSEGHPGLVNSLFARQPLRELILSWLEGNAVRLDERESGETLIRKFQHHRLREIQDRAVQRHAAPLLAAPTHAHGWIDPRVLVARLRQLAERAIEPPTFDLLQALLRLAPDHRPDALRDAASLPDVSGCAVRWAMGGADHPAVENDTGALWLAAGRARQPRGTLEALTLVVRGPDLPDGIAAAQYSWTSQEGKDAYHWKSSGAVDLRIVVCPQLVESPGNEARPTVALHEATLRGSRFEFGAPWVHQWTGQIWPLNADPFLAGGVLSLANRVNAAPSAFEPNHVFLEPLLEPDRPWTEMGYLALAVALVSKDSDSRGAALDALIAGIEDGRAAPARLADVLVRLLPGGWVKLNRVQQSLAEVARVSPLHAGTVAQLLEAFLTGVPTLPSDAHHLLGLLLELLTDLQTAPSENLRGRLQSERYSGKSAKLARSLLALAAMDLPVKLAEACRQNGESRLARAERWATSAFL